MDAGRVARSNSGCTRGSVSLLASWPHRLKKRLSTLGNEEGKADLKDHVGLQSSGS